jgi:pyruvate/2-oxoglutarate dehydrogenase complex dihydrolipoamide acyltransferase (E2) component
MTTDVRLPQWGMEMQDANIVRWFHAQGAIVAEGEPLVEVETSKVVETIVAPVGGVLLAILAPEGYTAHVGDVLARIGSATEQVS